MNLYSEEKINEWRNDQKLDFGRREIKIKGSKVH